jgi:hypothetical protein
MFSKQNLICCICGGELRCDIGDSWHAFEKAVCGSKCFYEKEWRGYLSLMNKPYRPDSRKYDEHGYPIREVQ